MILPIVPIGHSQIKNISVLRYFPKHSPKVIPYLILLKLLPLKAELIRIYLNIYM
jgi:hypothetical protein